MNRQQEAASKLAGLLHSDVVDSTALVREDESLAHRRIRDLFRQFSEIITAHGGETREIRGDALVAEFSRASDAVNAAWGESLAGLFDEARAHAELGLRLSPREMDLWLGVAYLALTQASFAERRFEEARKWGRLAIQMHATAPIRRALMIATCAFGGDRDEAQKQARRLDEFALDFIPSLLDGSLTLYARPEHNELLLQGLREAGLADAKPR